MFVPIVAIVGAIRLARLKSPWARRRYSKRPRKLARAERREARLDARWIAWRDAFFDLIAGKPHLPSLPPLGPEGSAAPAATTEKSPAAEPEQSPVAVTGQGVARAEPVPVEADCTSGGAGPGKRS